MRKVAWLAAAAALLAGVGVARAEGPTAPQAATNQVVQKAQTLCPVLGEPINKSVFVDYQGKRVYFCCAMCPPMFKKDPGKYMKKLEDQGVALDPAPAGEAAAPRAGRAEGIGAEAQEHAHH